MSRRDIRNTNTFQKVSLNYENEPEEGEIVDDYDLIVSSDEEQSMRQRIRELEAKNEEIEQITVISRSYVDKINQQICRAALVPTDVSSISSAEFVTPKKRKRRKSKDRKRKRRQHHSEQSHHYSHQLRNDIEQTSVKARFKRSHCKRRQKLFAKKYNKIYYDRLIHKKVNADSPQLESSESTSSTDTNNYNKFPIIRKEKSNNERYITRDTLRFAVARNVSDSRFPSKKYCLKEKLLKQKPVENFSYTDVDERRAYEEQIDNNLEDDDVQVIENDPIIQTVYEDSTDSMEERELRLIALKSAVLKKHMARKRRIAESAYSPTDFDEMLSSGILRQDKVDDVEVVDLETEDSQTASGTVSPVTSPQLEMMDEQEESQQMVDCKPVDMDIANSDSEDAITDNWSRDIDVPIAKYSFESQNFANNFPYEFYMQELNTPAPPPPGVDDYEDMPSAPLHHIPYSDEKDSRDSQERRRIEENKKNRQDASVDSLSAGAHQDEDVDEEEEALRALLLSKFQSPKNRKKSNCRNEVKEFQVTGNKNELIEQFYGKQKPTEIILKEAVKRLKIHSQTDHCKESKYNIENKAHEYGINNSDTLKIFTELRNRLNNFKHQSQPLSADQLKNDGDHFEDKEDVEISINHNVVSNNFEVRNTVDISDITRRLQRIKENVLNLTSNPLPENQPTDSKAPPNLLDASQPSLKKDFESVAIAESSQLPSESVRSVSQSLANNTANIASLNSTALCTDLNHSKKVQSNFNSATNLTTFKVTIANDTAFKCESDDITNSTNDTTYKENNNNNSSVMPKDLTFEINENSTNKITSNINRLVKFTNNTTQSFVDNNAQEIKSLKMAKPIMNDTKVTSAHAHSLLRTTKIVKPNKVINANYELNSRRISQATEVLPAQKLLNSQANNQLSNAITENTRLITSIEQVKHMCAVAPFVISVQNSSNESTEDEVGLECDSLYKPLHDYNDNASPLSLNLESPSRTPLRSNSPIENVVDRSAKHRDVEGADIKSATITPVWSTKEIDKTNSASLAVQDEKINKTPLAVRHLPAAAQSEYRRLVYRMKLLENKRKLSKLVESSTSTKNNGSKTVQADSTKEKDNGNFQNHVQKTSLVKKVLLKNTNTSDKQEANECGASSKSHKSNMLRSYENLYVKFGAGILNNLDKSLKLVEEAKRAKIAKLKLENRLKELKIEMDNLQAKHKEEQLKISHIYPNICSTNEIITSLKQKRSKVFKAALTLGKAVKGDVYRLNNDLKESITAKSKKLATEIKFVNSLKAQDIVNIDVAANVNSESERTNDESKNISDFEVKSYSEITKDELPSTVTANDATICIDMEVTKDEETKLHSPLKNEVSSNTEFQSSKFDNSNSDDDNLDNCPQRKQEELNNADPEKETKQPFSLSSYISPLEHLRNIDSNVDPNGVICPYDLMGNCEDVACKYIHLTAQAKT